MRPPAWITRELRRIDKDLSVAFLQPPGRWAVLHDFQHPERMETMVHNMATELQVDLLKRGYMTTRRVCEEASVQKIRGENIVFYVTEEDGSYRSLDRRVVEKIEKMDHHRRNWDVKDWKRYMNVLGRVQEEHRQKQWDDYNRQVKKDRVAMEYMADAVRGDPHLRSVNVTQEGKPARYPIADTADERKIILPQEVSNANT